MTWTIYPLDDDEIKRIEQEAAFEKEYCAWCDFEEGNPADDCFCETNCGSTGCLGD